MTKDESSVTNDPSHMTDQEKSPKKQREKVRLCNGEIFFITEDRTVQEDGTQARRPRRRRYLTLDDGDDRSLTLEYRKLQRECRLRHAWARTIHTFQGSENETIVYVLGDSKAQTWKHVYTAVTRGQKRVYVVATESSIASAVKTREIPRATRLGGLIKEQLVQPRLVTTPQGTPLGCSPPPFTWTPSRPPGSPSLFTPLRPRRLWKMEAAPFPVTSDAGQVTSGSPSSSSRLSAEPLAAEEEEEPEKQPATPGAKRPSSDDRQTPLKQPRVTTPHAAVPYSAFHGKDMS
ncbi:hypothetical protein LDENG_00167500 [Lucifuga dentata]|nr:hypothetical protein LDENG_00167500 [Lucifuga dentata]